MEAHGLLEAHGWPSVGLEIPEREADMEQRRLPRRANDDAGPEVLGEILSRLFAARGWGRRQGRLRLENAWQEVVGPEAAAHTRVGNLRRGVLEVTVDQAVLLQELAHFHKRRLLEGLRARLPELTFTDLRFRAGVWKQG